MRRPRGLLWALAGAVAMSAACAGGPPFRPARPISASDGGMSVEVDGVASALTDPGLALVARVSASPGTALRAAMLARPTADPCADASERAAVLTIDGADAWQRPVPLAGGGQQRLELRFPETFWLDGRVEGPLVLDLAITRAGDEAPGCLRVPIQQDDDKATWTPTSPWMAGLRIDFAPLAFGLRAGRFVGPVVIGIEDSVSSRYDTAAVVAAVGVYEGIGLEASYAGRWAWPGEAGAFRNGPRLRLFYGVSDHSRFETSRIGLGGFGVEVTHLWAAGAEPATTSWVVGIAGWVNPRAY